MGWKKMFIGEKMPDKDDPQYRQRYETEVKAGRKFAKTMKLDVLAAKVQLFANDHKLLFLYLVFGFIIFCFGLNIYRLVVVYSHQQSRQSATERQEQMLRLRHSKVWISDTLIKVGFLRLRVLYVSQKMKRRTILLWAI